MLMATISSIVAQTSDRWAIHVVCDNYFDEDMQKIKDFFAHIPCIRWTVTEKRYNDWGHTPRNIGVQQSIEEWVIQTGEDNYYVPTFVETFIEAVEKEKFTNMVFCNMVHNLHGWAEEKYIPIQCRIEVGFLDIGCFMLRTKYAKTLPIDTDLGVNADGYLAEMYHKKYGSAIHINRILYVHN